jgi:chemotaxis protein histidine kinase CheA
MSIYSNFLPKFRCNTCRTSKGISDYVLKKNDMPRDNICNQCKIQAKEDKAAAKAAEREAVRAAKAKAKAEEKEARDKAKAEAKAAAKAAAPPRKRKLTKKEEEEESKRRHTAAIREMMLAEGRKAKMDAASKKASPPKASSPSRAPIQKALSPKKGKSSSGEVSREEFNELKARVESAIVGLWHATDMATSVGESVNHNREVVDAQIDILVNYITDIPSARKAIKAEISKKIKEMDMIHIRNAMKNVTFHACTQPPNYSIYNYIPELLTESETKMANASYACKCTRQSKKMFEVFISADKDTKDLTLEQFKVMRRRKHTEDLPHPPVAIEFM